MYVCMYCKKYRLFLAVALKKMLTIVLKLPLFLAVALKYCYL